jgi:hypothetical protein
VNPAHESSTKYGSLQFFHRPTVSQKVLQY